MEKYIIGAVIAFFIIAIWEYVAHKKRNRQLAVFILSLFAEMSEMVLKMGYQDVFDYLTNVKGEQYAKIASVNLMNTLKTLNMSMRDFGAFGHIFNKHL